MGKGILVAGIISILALIFSFSVRGCGEIIDPDTLAVVVKTMGDRKTETVNHNKKKATEMSQKEDTSNSKSQDDELSSEVNEDTSNSKSQDDELSSEVNEGDGEIDVTNYDSELIRSRRAPIQTPSIWIFKFPLGNQKYRFTGRPSVESPNNEALTVNAIGGQVTFDVVFHMSIDPSYPDIKERLLKLIQDYQLRRFSGGDDALQGLMSGRFRSMLFKPFQEYSTDKKQLDLMRGKTEINAYALEQLNKRFNMYGIKFTLAAVCSSMIVPQDQQDKMNRIVLKEVELRVEKIKNEEIKPLEIQIEKLKQEGLTESQKIIDQAKANSITVITEAEKKRKALFIDLIGVERYIKFEAQLTLLKSLVNGNAKIQIVPQNATILMNSSSETPLVQTVTVSQ